jgi:hypothetical protein
MSTRFKDPWTWAYGLFAGIIGGAANTISAMLVDPVAFNFNDMPKLGKLALAGAVISAVLYLKQSPLPPLEQDEEEKPNA